MMASNRAATPPAAEPESPEANPPASVPSPPAPPEPAKLQPSPFLNGFDLVLALGCVVLGFGVASFAVRNSDFWLHLGIGRTIAQGQYEFGRAPFTYVGADRTWVNHSWLYEWFSYQLFNNLGGRSVVIWKAMLIALLTFILLRIKQPGQNLWLGVLTVGLALLTSAPYLTMQPVIVSCILLAVVLFLLTGVPSWSTTWKLPAALGATCWLWANCDQWFFLGPLSVALFFVGEQFAGGSAKFEDAQTRRRTLLISLGVSVVACMLNPHHFRVWQLPPELISGSLKETLGSDAQYAPLFRRLFEKGSLDFTGTGGGNPVNAYSLILLLALNIIGFLINAKKSSMGLMLINVALFVLAFFHARALPFYAIAAAPITALNIGQYLDGNRDRTYLYGTLQLIAAGRVFTRMILLVVGLLALTACYPGWLHPFDEQRRLSWDVDPDSALVKTSQKLASWRAEGKVPTEVHGLILNADLAHYCAWYAPSEPTYFDLRLGLHASEAENFVKLKRHFYTRKMTEIGATEAGAMRIVEDLNVVYLVLSSKDRDDLIFPLARLLQTRDVDIRPPQPSWNLWEVSGRSFVLGRKRQAVMDPEKFKAMRYSALDTVLGDAVERIPDPGPLDAPSPRDFADRFLTPSKEAAAATDEALMLYEYQAYLWLVSVQRQLTIQGARQVFVGGMLADFIPLEKEFRQEHLAASLSAIRAARRGIIANPHAPEGYYALAESYVSEGWRFFPPSEGWLFYPSALKPLVRVASLERYMARLTPDQKIRPTIATLYASEQLYRMHAGSGRMDLAYRALQQYLLGLRNPPEGVSFPDLSERIKFFEQRSSALEKELRSRENIWLNNAANNPSVIQRAIAAAGRLPEPKEEMRRVIPGHGLPLKALQMLNEIKLDESSKISIGERFLALLARIELSLLAGQAEDADRLIQAIDHQLDNDLNRPEMQQLRANYLQMKLNVYVVLGRFDELAKLLYQQESEQRLGLEAFKQNVLPKLLAARETIRWGFPLPLQVVHFHINREGNGFESPVIGQVPGPDIRLMQFVILGLESHEQTLCRLAMTNLEQANNQMAVAHFDQCIRSAQSRHALEKSVWGVERRASLEELVAGLYLNLLKNKP